MKILMRRSQTAGRFFSVKFKLWAQLELDSEERALIDRYDFDRSILIFIHQENRIRNAIVLAAMTAVIVFFVAAAPFGRAIGITVAITSLISLAWFLMDYWRETVYVKDLIHGRYFKCNSIERLVSKEHFLRMASSYLRQVIETAKHWDGTQSEDIPVLDPETAKKFLLKKL